MSAVSIAPSRYADWRSQAARAGCPCGAHTARSHARHRSGRRCCIVCVAGRQLTRNRCWVENVAAWASPTRESGLPLGGRPALDGEWQSHVAAKPIRSPPAPNMLLKATLAFVCAMPGGLCANVDLCTTISRASANTCLTTLFSSNFVAAPTNLRKLEDLRIGVTSQTLCRRRASYIP